MRSLFALVLLFMADADGPLDERGVLLEEKACEEFSCPLFVNMQPLGAGQGNQAHHLGKGIRL